MTGRLRVVHSDPRTFVREAVSLALPQHGDIEVVASTDRAETTILQADRTNAAVVAVSVSFDGELAVICSGLRELDPRPRTLVLDATEDQDALLHAIESGADGYFSGSAGLQGLVEAIDALGRGESVVPPSMLGPLLRRLIQRRREASQATGKLERLTPRERQVLGLLVDGLDHVRIGEELFISPDTARTHVQRILRKLEVHSRLEAITLVVQSGAADELERMVEGASA